MPSVFISHPPRRSADPSEERIQADAKRRWRIHFVTTHFSPAVTGAPVCSDSASTWPLLLQ